MGVSIALHGECLSPQGRWIRVVKARNGVLVFQTCWKLSCYSLSLEKLINCCSISSHGKILWFDKISVSIIKFTGSTVIYIIFCDHHSTNNIAVCLDRVVASPVLASSVSASIVSSNTTTMAGVSEEKSPQSAEVAAVKAAFPGRCRVIKDIGMFSSVVTIQPQNLDATLKFQLTG